MRRLLPSQKILIGLWIGSRGPYAFAWLLAPLIGLLVMVVVCLSSCYDPRAQESAVVRLLEANGSGDISTYTAIGLQEWMSQHRDVAEQAYRMCRPIYARADASWATTAEGNVCLIARNYEKVTLQSDQKQW